MIIRYAILEKTPFPGEWLPLATCDIQEAEFHTFKGDKHYHQRTLKMRYTSMDRRVYLYLWEDAQALIRYMQKQRDFAEYKVLGFVTSK